MRGYDSAGQFLGLSADQVHQTGPRQSTTERDREITFRFESRFKIHLQPEVPSLLEWAWREFPRGNGASDIQ